MTRLRLGAIIGTVGLGVLLGASALLLQTRLDVSGSSRIGGPFSLTDGAGHRVTQSDFDGDWQLVYFGYTHCPDACPTTLATLGAALDKLPSATRGHVRVLFITVDPARDTPAAIGSYVKAFGREFVGLTGSQTEVSSVAASFHIYARRHDLPGGDYAMDHSSIIYVLRPNGMFAGLLDDGLSSTEMAKRLIELGA